MANRKPQFGTPGELAKPPHIVDDPVASEFWDWTVSVLGDMAALSDAAGLALLCESYSDYRYARETNGARGVHLEKYHNRYYRLLKAFGLTPESRKNVPQVEQEETDPLVELQRRVVG